MLGQYYQVEDYTAVNLPEGDYYAKIIAAKEDYSKKGDLMAIITLSIRETPIEFRYWIVENEYFNKNMTRFFDCFKIGRGDFNMQHWLGKNGYVHIAKGKPNESGQTFLEIKSLVIPPAGQPPRTTAPKQTPPAQPSHVPQQPAYTRPDAPATLATQSLNRQQQFEREYDSQQSQYSDDMPFPEDIPF